MTNHRKSLRIVRALLVVVLLCVTIAVGMVFFENSMIYYPTRYPDGMWDTGRVGDAIPGTVEDHFFATADGLRLHGWWCRPAEAEFGTAQMLLLWFHGNAGNLSDRADLMVRLARLPVQVFIVDYRGYGRSEGRPSEQGLYRDADAAWRYLVSERRVRPGQIVVFGKSLGGVPAVDLATRVNPAGLILESTFTSVPDMAARHFPFIPGALIRSRMDSLSKIADIRVPKLHIHSPSDEVVPYQLGKRLYEAAATPKRFYEVDGAGHNETYIVGGPRYFRTIRAFVDECQTRAG
jgi:fermentation-respiration switch protein FrsA (DUF1100 family)